MTDWGVALAGGGTRGVYQIGVWKALIELGVKVGAITGTSIGSVNGALFCQGDYELADKMWHLIKAENIFDMGEELVNADNLFDYKNFLKIAQEVVKKDRVKTTPFQELLLELVDEEKLRKSPIEFGVTMTLLSGVEGESVFLEDIPEGQVVNYLLASTSFPGFQKRYIENKEYLDGGITNNLPVDMLIKRGYKNIIAVDVKGIGFVRGNEKADTNIVTIKCNKPQIGMFEFDKKLMDKAIKQGYLDTYKAFGRLCGNKYYFNILDYYKSRMKYSEELLNGLEIASEYFGINELAVYKVEDLIDGVIGKYNQIIKTKKNENISIEDVLKLNKDKRTVAKLVNLILDGKMEWQGNKLLVRMLGNKLDAAGAVAYFIKNK